MKLLQPTEAKQRKDKEEAVKRIRTAELQREYDEKVRLRNQADADFEKALKAQEEAWAKEKEAHQQWREDARREVEEFDRLQGRTLAPLEKRAEGLQEGQVLFLESLGLLEKEKDEVEELRTSLHRRLAEVGERESAAKDLERSLESQKRGIETQSTNLKEQSQRFTASLEQLSMASAERERQFARREADIQAKDEALTMERRRITQKEQELTEKEYRLGLFKLSLERTYKKKLEE